MDYVVKYGILPSNIIENTIEPTQERIDLLEELQGFFTKLEISVLGEGFRNPIVVDAHSKDNIVSRYGGSRLLVAHKHEMDIPCIVIDFNDVFPDLQILNNTAEIYASFKDRPKKIFYKPHGLNISGCQHIHLKEDEMSWTYTARYVVIPSNLIFNECGPMSAGPTGWSEDKIKKREIAAQKYIDTLNRKNGFYNNLEASILKEGVRNPILVTAGWCPERKILNLPLEMQEDHSKILVCHSSGGSRLWIAQKYNLDIPCIVSDFCNMFPEGKLLETAQDVLECHKDEPRAIKIGGHGVFVTDLPQSYME